MRRVLLTVLFIAIAGIACGSSSESHDPHAAMNGAMSDGQVPGKPGKVSSADRKVVVSASDELRFQPSRIQVALGETVTFVVRNEGKAPHEFILGDKKYQDQHEAAMKASHNMANISNAITVAAGETKRLTWKFSERGWILFACHEPGHYKGGMVGAVYSF